MSIQPEASVPASQVAESRYFVADGIETHYLEAGDPNAQTVILVHGGGAGANAMGNWAACIPLFTENFHVIAPEMVGFGDTEKPGGEFEYSQGARNRHMAAFIEGMGLGPACIVGNSMGGATALGVAMERPELIDRLVLMGSAGLNAQITPSMAPILNYDFTFEGMRRLVAALTGPKYEATEEILASRYESSIRPDARAAYGKTMAWIGEQGGLFYEEDAIAAVKHQTLVVSGKDDLVVPFDRGVRFLELLENSRGYFMPHIGHWVMIEAPEEFVDVVTSFLQIDEEQL
ncbi:alpha/beta hydrolase [Erythrobacter sp. KY5]|uniref:alpha/beta fold hydrolase n=1 Tax=Erythrobacter sp. KY5 TaxID=2011159 RepID=UPI000DBF1A46|nr:alpha/beta hydrolase [Erythrobacter sp. KY5]AWW74411.1 alpha/beta hydrolase [Erythrobacter sp. KY5]